MSSQAIPSELRISKKWDDVIENGIINVSTGFLAAGVASIVLFRKYYFSYLLFSPSKDPLRRKFSFNFLHLLYIL